LQKLPIAGNFPICPIDFCKNCPGISGEGNYYPIKLDAIVEIAKKKVWKCGSVKV